MKYEDFVIGQTYLYRGIKEKVIAKVSANKQIVTLDEENNVNEWRDFFLEKFKPIDKMQVFRQKTHELVTLGKELGYSVNVTIENK